MYHGPIIKKGNSNLVIIHTRVTITLHICISNTNPITLFKVCHNTNIQLNTKLYIATQKLKGRCALLCALLCCCARQCLVYIYDVYPILPRKLFLVVAFLFRKKIEYLKEIFTPLLGTNRGVSKHSFHKTMYKIAIFAHRFS